MAIFTSWDSRFGIAPLAVYAIRKSQRANKKIVLCFWILVKSDTTWTGVRQGSVFSGTGIITGLSIVAHESVHTVKPAIGAAKSTQKNVNVKVHGALVLRSSWNAGCSGVCN
jgi:hypothetical protein